MKKVLNTALLVSLAFASHAASAGIVSLDFEGVGDQQAVGNFYNGGAGTNYGVEFSGSTLGIIDADAGGNGNFANEPSPNTIMFFLDGNKAILNYAAGFDTGFSFFYTSRFTTTVSVYDDVNGKGNLLATLKLDAQHNSNCKGDPSGDFCNWTAVGASFSGVAKSINFSGTANQVGFDNITFGSDKPVVTSVPENDIYAMMLAGLGLVGFAARRRQA